MDVSDGRSRRNRSNTYHIKLCLPNSIWKEPATNSGRSHFCLPLYMAQQFPARSSIFHPLPQQPTPHAVPPLVSQSRIP